MAGQERREMSQRVSAGRLETEERVVVEEREEADAVSGGVRETDGGRSGTLVETGEAVRDDDGLSGTLEETDEEARDGDGSGVQEREETECGSSSEEAPAASKRRRLSEITAMGMSHCRPGLIVFPERTCSTWHFCCILPAIFGLKKTDTAAAVGDILQKNERTIRRWIDDFASNEGEFSDSQQGHYTRSTTLMSNDGLCEKARVYIRENAAPKGRPNLTAAAFCQWVNNDLLPNSTLEPGYPRRVSVETARKWLHDLGFDGQHMSKGVFIDGHERPDVVESRKQFLRKMTECGFRRPDNAPTEEAARALPADV